MKINRSAHKRLTIEEFADSEGLSLDVHENECGYYFVKFSGSLMKDGYFLVGCAGEGESEENAVKNYIKIVSGKTLSVYDSDTRKSRDVYVPTLKEVQ